jgi:hypothetical protein
MGCLRNLAYQIGCLVIGAALAIGLFVFRDQVAAVYHRVKGTPPRAETGYVSATPASRLEATRTLERLADRGGPAYVDLEADEIASLIEEAIGRAGGRGLDSIQVGLMENEIRLRGSLDMSRVPRDLLGPLAGMVDQREPVIIGGPLARDSTGRLYLEVTTLRVDDFPFPRGMIARLLREARMPGTEGTRVSLPAMRGISDVRVSPEYVRIYRAAPVR